jgi:outer membrane receptor protein involved in Fe transport
MKTCQTASNPWAGRYLILAFLVLFVLQGRAPAQEKEEEVPPPRPRSGWSVSVQSGYVHQFETDMDEGGSFSRERLFAEGGLTYAFDHDQKVSLALGYGFDDYDFSGSRGFAGLRAWEEIHSYRISTPVEWGLDDDWRLFVIPTLRFTGESDADFGDGLTGGGFVGCAYRVSDTLTLGPGLGVLSQLEDDASVFPVLLVHWRITETLTLGTGRSAGATLGPGLALSWVPDPRWTLSIGARYERLRFRLDDDAPVPEGIGEDSSLPLFGSVVYSPIPQTRIGLVGGVGLNGELRLEDEGGDRIAKDDYDPAAFLGLTFSLRL